MNEPESGEDRLRRRRHSLSRFSLLMIALSMLVGALAGAAAVFHERGDASPMLVWPLLAIWLGIYGGATIGYFRRVDELEIADNLWAATAALLVYVPLLPSWYLLHQFGWTGAPDQWAVWIVTIATTFIAYLYRKLR